MISVSISGSNVDSKYLENIVFMIQGQLITEDDTCIKIAIPASIPIPQPLGMIIFVTKVVFVTLPIALQKTVQNIRCLMNLNLFLCKELKKQELTEEKANHQKEAADRQKEAVARKKEAAKMKKEAASKKRCQERQAKREELKKQREDKKKARLQKKKKARGIKKEYVLIERDLRLQYHILLGRIRIIKANYEKYDFSGKRPRTCLSMLEFNLERALKTGQPLQRFINSATKHLQDLNPRRRLVIAA